MGKRTLLTAQETDAALGELNAAALEPWKIDDGKLIRRYDFETFCDAFGFMAQTALACEKLDHHPRWVNVWTRVDISLFTFHAGGITRLDFELAGRMEQLARKLLA